MNTNSQAKLLLIVLTAGLVTACGEFAGKAEIPTTEEVKAWRLKTTPTRVHTVVSYEISDLKCGVAPSSEIERVKSGYAGIGANADKAIRAYASCSYTVNAQVKGIKKLYIAGNDYAYTNHQVKDELFLLGGENGKREWQGSLALPNSK